jgi:hypothetical protein
VSSSGYDDATSNAALLTVAPITVTSQPANKTGTPVAGTTPNYSASFAAAATSPAGPPTLQWQVSTDGGTTFSDLSGQTSSSLALTGLTTADSGKRYRARFARTGWNNVSSNDATLTVPTDVITVTQQPSNTTASVSQFSSAAFSLPAGSWEGISYAGGKWFATPRNLDFGGDYIATSGDGITWTKQLLALPVPARWSRVVYYDGIYLTHLTPLPSSGTQYATSTDGVTWTPRSSSNIRAESNPIGVVTMPGVGFVLLTPQSTSTGAAYSSDGVTWTPAWGGTVSYPAQSGNRVVSVLGGVFNSVSGGTDHKIGTQVGLGERVFSTVVNVGSGNFSLTRIDVLAENYFAVYGQFSTSSVFFLLSYADANATTPTVTESNLPGSSYDMAVAVAGSRLVAAGNLGFYTSADGGGTWALRQSAALYPGGTGQTSGRFFVSGRNGQKLNESSHFVLFTATGNKSVLVFYTG